VAGALAFPPEMANVADDEPAGTVTDCGIVATAGLFW